MWHSKFWQTKLYACRVHTHDEAITTHTHKQYGTYCASCWHWYFVCSANTHSLLLMCVCSLLMHAHVYQHQDWLSDLDFAAEENQEFGPLAFCIVIHRHRNAHRHSKREGDEETETQRDQIMQNRDLPEWRQCSTTSPPHQFSPKHTYAYTHTHSLIQLYKTHSSLIWEMG